jgi:hypothetical protein
MKINGEEKFCDTVLLKTVKQTFFKETSSGQKMTGICTKSEIISYTQCCAVLQFTLEITRNCEYMYINIIVSLRSTTFNFRKILNSKGF